jgi:hypothetical protein
MSAHLISGEVVTIVERCYLTRADGETVMYGARALSGRFIKAADIRWIS